MDRHQLFLKIIDTLHSKGIKEDRIHEHEDYIMYVFDSDSEYVKANFRRLQAEIKEKGWKTEGEVMSPTVLDTYALIYRPKTNSIHYNKRTSGYMHSFHKKRYYPVVKTTPLPAFTDKGLWGFNFKRKPRRLKGGFNMVSTSGEGKLIVQAILGIDYDWSNFQVGHKFFQDTKDKYEMLERYSGARVPKALRFLCDEDLLKLCQVVEPNDMNKLCQVMSANKEARFSNLTDVMKMVFNIRDSHFVSDFIGDHVALKKKLNLKASSVKRMEEEHRRMTRERALRGIKKITVWDKYRNALEKIDPEVKWELIENAERLLEETQNMSHCVASYGDKINQGNCAIFHLEYKGEPWTLEVVERTQNRFGTQMKGLANNQLKGIRNALPSSDLEYIINHALDFTWQSIAEEQVALAEEQHHNGELDLGF